MKYVLVTVSGGIIDEVRFFDKKLLAIQNLSSFVKTMDPERHDAAVYDPDGMIANAKLFLDENEHRVEEIANMDEKDEHVYVIANPLHRLGFMVASPDDPLGYKEPVAALSDLGQMRKDHGFHLKLYRVQSVNAPVMQTKDLETYNKACEIEDFDYSLVSEYLD